MNQENIFKHKVQFIDNVHMDIDSIVEFHGQHNSDYLVYEYQNNKKESAVFITAVDNINKIIGTQALIPYPLNIDGKILLTGRSERSLVAKSYRGAGLFQDLMEYCAQCGQEKGLNFIWGTTVLKKAFKRAEFLYKDKFFEHAILILNNPKIISDILSEKDRRLKYVKSVLLPASFLIHNIFFYINKLMLWGKDLIVKQEPYSYEDIHVLYKEIRGQEHLVTISQDEIFIDWLLNKGNRKILKYYAYEDKNLLAYLYVDISDKPTAYIIDYAAKDLSALNFLITHTINIIKKDRDFYYLYVCYNFKNKFLKKMRSTFLIQGFVPFYRGGGMVFRPLTYNDMNILNTIEYWYITKMWTMLYRN